MYIINSYGIKTCWLHAHTLFMPVVHGVSWLQVMYAANNGKSSLHAKEVTNPSVAWSLVSRVLKAQLKVITSLPKNSHA